MNTERLQVPETLASRGAPGRPILPPAVAGDGEPPSAGPLGPLGALEAALAASPPQAQAALAEASARIAELTWRTRKAMRTGGTRDDFALLNAVAKACAAAQETLTMVGAPDDHCVIRKTG